MAGTASLGPTHAQDRFQDQAGGGQTVETKTAFGTPEWYGAVRHAAAEAKRLGLEMALFSSPGWSETGGP